MSAPFLANIAPRPFISFQDYVRGHSFRANYPQTAVLPIHQNDTHRHQAQNTPQAGSDLKPDCSSELGKRRKKKKNRPHGSLLNGQIRRLKKWPKKKKFPFGFFFLSPNCRTFFSRTWRQSLPLGRIRGRRKLFRQKLEPGTENKKSQEI